MPLPNLPVPEAGCGGFLIRGSVGAALAVRSVGAVAFLLGRAFLRADISDTICV